MNKIFYGLIFLLMAGFVSAVDLSACGTISSTDTYSLTQPIGSGGDCIIITANDVVINGNGYTITGNINGDSNSGSAYSGLVLNNLVVDGYITLDGFSDFMNVGAGGSVSLTNSQVSGYISADAGVGGMGSASGGSVSLIDSVVVGDVSVRGSDGMYDVGAGGSASLNNSAVANIFAMSGTVQYTNGAVGGTVVLVHSNASIINVSSGDAGGNNVAGGSVTISNGSRVVSVFANGGSVRTDQNSDGMGGNGGSVTISNSFVSNIMTANGGNKGNWGGQASGSGGTFIITDSTVSDVSAKGGVFLPEGAGGSITLTDSCYGVLDVSGSPVGSTSITGTCCVPDWSCTGYATCVEPALNVSCNAVSDLNTCGQVYGGDFSEFAVQECSYPVQESRGVAVAGVSDKGSKEIPVITGQATTTITTTAKESIWARIWAWIVGLFS